MQCPLDTTAHVPVSQAQVAKPLCLKCIRPTRGHPSRAGSTLRATIGHERRICRQTVHRPALRGTWSKVIACRDDPAHRGRDHSLDNSGRTGNLRRLGSPRRPECAWCPRVGIPATASAEKGGDVATMAVAAQWRDLAGLCCRHRQPRPHAAAPLVPV